MRDLAGKTAFITGAASGLGLGMARTFAEAGMKLVLADVNGEALARAAADLENSAAQVLALPLDVADRSAMAQAAEAAERRFGAVQLLCNNAGIMAMGWTIDEIPVEIFDLVLRIDLTAVFNGVRAFLPRMKARGQGGHIVNTASMSGLRPRGGHAVYAAAKAGVIGMSEAMRAELDPHGIGVSVLCPGPVRTWLLPNSSKLRAGVEEKPAPGYQTDLQAVPNALDPLDVGRAVRRAVEANTMYIVTHADNRQAIEDRHRLIMEAFEAADRFGLG